MTQLLQIVENARKAQGNHAHLDQYGDVRAVTKMPAASIGVLSVRELFVPPMVGASSGHAVTNPLGTSAGKKTTIETAVLEQSRIANAGSHIITVSSAAVAVPSAVNDNGQVPVVGLYRRESSFTTIEAAPFAIVPDGQDVADSALPLKRALINLDDFPAYGFRVALSRADQKAYGDDVLTDSALAAIALGLARAADKCLLDAIAASSLTEFSLNAAAARGLRFNELRALIGTRPALPDGNVPSVVVGPQGVPLVRGVPAELTADTAGTYVGAFDRAAVAISEEVTLLAERRNMQGDLVLTCWANLEALLPDSSAFFKVSDASDLAGA